MVLGTKGAKSILLTSMDKALLRVQNELADTVFVALLQNIIDTC
jgi:hypothetical protein